MATIFALAKLADHATTRRADTSSTCRTLCGLLAERMREQRAAPGDIDDDYIANIAHAAPLHDIGKVAIPDSILLKPGPLTAEEFEVMKAHTVTGADTLEAVSQRVPDTTRSSRWGSEIAGRITSDGTGPGTPTVWRETHPSVARIMTVVDVYDAVRSRRCYKHAVSHRGELRSHPRRPGSTSTPR